MVLAVLEIPLLYLLLKVLLELMDVVQIVYKEEEAVALPKLDKLKLVEMAELQA
jgi:hypothetical protein